MPIDSDAFRDSIEKLSLSKVDLVDMSQSVKSVRLRTILDFPAPLSNRTVTVRPAAPGYSNEIKKTAGKALEEKPTVCNLLLWRKASHSQ